LYFADPLPLARVQARAEDLMNLDSYECFTCLKDGTVVHQKEPSGDCVDRDADGRVQYAWKCGTSRLVQRHQKPLVRFGRMQNNEGLIQLRDRDGNEEVLAHAGSVYWNEYRKRWIAVFTQHYGKSMLGEVWYGEAASPLGPWAYAVRIATHGDYSFYNPKQHPMFDADGGRVIFFEGTYSHTFSGNPRQTPWYDYNQLMYRLDLSDGRLAIPVPVFRTATQSVTLSPPQGADDNLLPSWSAAPWFALDRPTLNCVAVIETAEGWQAARSQNMNEFTPALFHALRADEENPPASTVLLYQYNNTDGARFYDVEGAAVPEGYERAAQSLCRVWRSPYRR
jgi:hypothetical protein